MTRNTNNYIFRFHIPEGPVYMGDFYCDLTCDLRFLGNVNGNYIVTCIENICNLSTLSYLSKEKMRSKASKQKQITWILSLKQNERGI